MKKLLLLVVLALTFVGLNAQISITSSDMPGSGDTLRYSNAIVDSITLSVYDTTSTNFTWDFSHLEPTSQGVAAYKSSLQTPYAFFFFGFNKYGRKEIDSIGFGAFQFKNIYSFYKKTTAKFEAEGIGMTFSGLPLPAYYTDKDEIYQFPLNYGDQDNSTFAFSIGLPTFGTYASQGTRTNTVDGWGQITTPYGTFNCIRVVSDIVAIDSILVTSGIGFGFPRNQRTYQWLTTGEKIPILEISGQADSTSFTPTQVRYRDIYRTITNTSPFAPTADFNADNLTPTTIDTVNFTSNSGFLAGHSWSFSPNTVSYVNGTTNTSRDPIVVFNAAGVYDVTLNVSNPFGSDDTTIVSYITVSNPVNTIDLTIKNKVELYPNPVQNQLTLSYFLENRQTIQLVLYDLKGQQIGVLLEKQGQIGQQQHQFDLLPYQLTTGVYLLKFRIGDKEQYFKIVVTK